MSKWQQFFIFLKSFLLLGNYSILMLALPYLVQIYMCTLSFQRCILTIPLNASLNFKKKKG
ncbi:hypothetical protein JCM19046_1546 [Bacillus sp. JCM 19046]|nr:hypothetical protein JCM19045_2486 [Bacillus sp. JCM 19045]GAF17067.1 hypothetical protein JCM19046_1546 [Bacillus sp. JCM 19046]